MPCTAPGSTVGTLPSRSPVVGLHDSSAPAAATDSSVAAIAADYRLRRSSSVDLRALHEHLGEQRAESVREAAVAHAGVRLGVRPELDGADADDGLGPADRSHGADHDPPPRVVAHEAL